MILRKEDVLIPSLFWILSRREETWSDNNVTPVAPERGVACLASLLSGTGWDRSFFGSLYNLAGKDASGGNSTKRLGSVAHPAADRNRLLRPGRLVGPSLSYERSNMPNLWMAQLTLGIVAVVVGLLLERKTDTAVTTAVSSGQYDETLTHYIQGAMGRATLAVGVALMAIALNFFLFCK